MFWSHKYLLEFLNLDKSVITFIQIGECFLDLVLLCFSIEYLNKTSELLSIKFTIMISIKMLKSNIKIKIILLDSCFKSLQ